MEDDDDTAKTNSRKTKTRMYVPQHRWRAADAGLQASEDEEEPSDVSEAELEVAARGIATRKAPGVDGVPGLAIRTAALSVPEPFRDTFSACLREGTYPEQWKVQRLVFHPKGNKPPEEPSSYRPLCLLAGKLFERVLHGRLEAAIERAGGLSDNQFGFRKGRSTVDAIGRVVPIATDAISGTRCTKRMFAVIALDVRNAFNSARWDNILLTLQTMGIPLYLRAIVSSNLSNRTL